MATTTTSEMSSDVDELEWLSRILGGPTAGPIRPYLCRPSLLTPQLLIPTNPSPASQAAVRRFSSDQGTKQTLMAAAGSIAARAGLLSHAPGKPISLPTYALIDELARRLGEPELIPSISLGPRRRNRKPVIQLIRPDGVVVGFAKVGWSRLTKELIANEAHWLGVVENRLPPGVVAPTNLTYLGSSDWTGGSNVLVSSALRTTRAHRGAPVLDDRLALRIARITPEEHRRVTELPYLAEAANGPHARLVESLINRHGTTEVELGMWHGDLTPWNTGHTNGQLLIWDWEFADGGRPVGFDVLHRSFEQARRSGPSAEAVAVEHIAQHGPEIARPFTDAPGATVDLYLFEILERETRLAGQGWEPGHIGPLAPFLTDALTDRLRP